MWKLQRIQSAQQYHLREEILSYKIPLYITGFTISDVFSLVMNKSLHPMHVKTCTSRCDPLPLHHPLPYCAHIHCMEEFSDTTLLHMHFQLRHHFVRLPLCHRMWEASVLLLYHQYRTLTALAKITKQEASFLEQPSYFKYYYKYVLSEQEGLLFLDSDLNRNQKTKSSVHELIHQMWCP